MEMMCQANWKDNSVDIGVQQDYELLMELMISKTYVGVQGQRVSEEVKLERFSRKANACHRKS